MALYDEADSLSQYVGPGILSGIQHQRLEGMADDQRPLVEIRAPSI